MPTKLLSVRFASNISVNNSVGTFYESTKHRIEICDDGIRVLVQDLETKDLTYSSLFNVAWYKEIAEPQIILSEDEDMKPQAVISRDIDLSTHASSPEIPPEATEPTIRRGRPGRPRKEERQPQALS